MTNATIDPPKAGNKPILLRAKKRRWRGYYMIGPDEVAGDLFWWEPKDRDRVNGKLRLPENTEAVVDGSVDPGIIPKPPKPAANQAPGAGPRRFMEVPTLPS